jgi:hypothetical protein
MPVSKHRRRNKTPPRKPDTSSEATLSITTIEDLRRQLANPSLGFTDKIGIASLWWYEQLLSKIGHHRQSGKASRKDKQTAAMLLCIAMDGEQGQNDALAPILASMLRPGCPAPTFVEAWEQSKHLPPGTVRTKAGKFLESLQSGGPKATHDQPVS